MTSDAGFDDFLRAAGRSLTEAQGDVAGPQALAATMAISEVDLEVRATFDQGEGGELRLRTVTAKDARDLPAGALSTVKARFVAVSAPEAVSGAPVRTAKEIVDDVRGREDVQRLERILGTLEVRVAFVPETSRWLATAVDPSGRVVREVIVPDERGG